MRSVQNNVGKGVCIIESNTGVIMGKFVFDWFLLVNNRGYYACSKHENSKRVSLVIREEVY